MKFRKILYIFCTISLFLIPSLGCAESEVQDNNQKIIDDYRKKISKIVHGNWSFNEELLDDDKNIETKIIFKILPDGTIVDIFLAKESGNVFLDESAYRAVQKSNPVKPHPEGFNKSEIYMGLKFEPKTK